MTTSINVDKRSVKQLLETGKNKRFIIPEYQRPYAWSDEQIQVLFDDLNILLSSITYTIITKIHLKMIFLFF